MGKTLKVFSKMNHLSHLYVILPLVTQYKKHKMIRKIFGSIAFTAVGYGLYRLCQKSDCDGDKILEQCEEGLDWMDEKIYNGLDKAEEMAEWFEMPKSDSQKEMIDVEIFSSTTQNLSR